MRYDHYKEATWPLTYRRQEIACLAAPLALQRSIRVAGLSGMGKSNLLRFLVSHPPLLAAPPNPYFLYIDCNRLQPVNPFNFYRESCSLLSGRPVAPPADEYLAFKALAEALAGLDRQSFVIWVIDRVERLYGQTDGAFWSQLRSLRDEARAGEMAFILAGRRPVGPLQELEKLFSDTCWVGPLAETDWQPFLARHEARLGINLEAGLAGRLWTLAGGHPGLLKNGLEWFKRQGREDVPGDEAGLLQGLLAYEPVRRYCHHLWADLTPVEQSFLMALEEPAPPAETAQLLQACGLIKKSAGGWRFFSPLWEAYLRQTVWQPQEAGSLQIELEPEDRRVRLHWLGRTAETVITRPLVFNLMQVLAATPGQTVSKDTLINSLYPEEKAPEVMDDALFQLVTALRRSLIALLKKLSPTISHNFIENVRGLGYRLVVDLPRKDSL